jgi:hypothetical protein
MPDGPDTQRTTVDSRSFAAFGFSGTGGGNVDDRQLIAQVSPVAGR